MRKYLAHYGLGYTEYAIRYVLFYWLVTLLLNHYGGLKFSTDCLPLFLSFYITKVLPIIFPFKSFYPEIAFLY